MLSRAAIPLLRPLPRRLHIPPQLGFGIQRWRGYASKPKRPSGYTQSSPASSSGKFVPGSAKGRAAADAKAESALNQKKQGESSEKKEESRSDKNTEPQSSSPSAVDPADVQSQKPLPDLTHGIPSTIGIELDQLKQSDQYSESTSVAKVTGRGGGGGGGELPKSAYESSIDRRRNRNFNWAYIAFLLFGTGACVYLGRNWETEEEEKKHGDAPSGWGLGLFWDRIKARTADQLNYYREPSFPKLLPDPDPSWARPYTLVLSLEDLLVYSEWSREHGWRTAKRPGVDYFLRYLSQYYELVIFTSVPLMMADPVIRKLDPFRFIMWPLGREATLYSKGEYIKDLSHLNRDLSKVILIDTDPTHAKFQPENAVILPKWKGNSKDRELVKFIPFLEYVASMGFSDVREVLKSFENQYIPEEFARRESLLRKKFEKELAEERAKKPKHTGMSILGSLLGIKPTPTMDGMESASEGMAQGKMLIDLIRERGQKSYELMEKEIQENGQKYLAEMAEEEKKAQEEAMKGYRQSVSGMFTNLGTRGQDKKPEGESK
ncbi:MAG: mitochondrial inner membrane protein required for protein import [Cirrosporium novae-zelandiae]|nr:MAG: mitochondrial inner membrane protein required for protein import [Cirrosporium novae-zelandiae]